MQLIDKQDYIRCGLGLVQDLLQALLKLSPVLGASNNAGQIQHHNPLIQQHFWNFIAGNALGQAFYNSCLADARLSY